MKTQLSARYPRLKKAIGHDPMLDRLGGLRLTWKDLKRIAKALPAKGKRVQSDAKERTQAAPGPAPTAPVTGLAAMWELMRRI